MNHAEVAGIINALPIEKMIAAPLVAAVKAQSEMSMAMANFIDNVGIDNEGNIRMVTFKYEETNAGNLPPRPTDETKLAQWKQNAIATLGLDANATDAQIEAASSKATTRYIQAPFLAMTGIPNMAVENVNISFELEVTTAEENKSHSEDNFTNKTTASFRSFWSPVNANTEFTGSVSHSSDQTRRTDTRAKYAFNVTASRQGPPEALMRIVDAITNAAAQPTSTAKNDNLLVDGQGAKRDETGKLQPQQPAQA